MLNVFSKKSRKTTEGMTSKPAKQLPKTFGPPWQIILNVIIFFIASQVIAIFFVELFLGLLHPHTNLNNALDQSAPGQFFYILLAESLAAGLVLYVLRRRGLKLSAIGLGRKPAWRDLTRGLAGFAIFYLTLIISTLIISVLIPSLNTNQTQDVGFNTLNTTLDGIFAFVSLVILPPLGEEILVRGYLFSGLRSRWKFVPAMLVTSLIFGIAHLQLGSGTAAVYVAGIDTFVLSVVLVYLRETTGALYAGMLVHSLNNVVAFAVHFHSAVYLLK